MTLAQARDQRSHAGLRDQLTGGSRSLNLTGPTKPFPSSPGAPPSPAWPASEDAVNPASRVVIVIFVVAAAAGGVFLWRQHQRSSLAPKVSTVAPAAPVALAPVAPPPPDRPGTSIVHPIQAGGAPSREPLPKIDESDSYIKKALGDLTGHRKGWLSFLALDGFARRFVATVNNLATDNAAAELWPVHPTAGRLVAEEEGGQTAIGPKNAERYVPLVRLINEIDDRRAVALYARLYPLFQSAYEDLGFPGRYFNDRVIEVIDQLLATPTLTGPIKIKRVDGRLDGNGVANPSGAGGGLYMFADPTLEASSAGQKILLRIGPENAALLKAKLADVRRLIVAAAPARAAR
jgi:hypothetical protein